jgi:hypothetical protein
MRDRPLIPGQFERTLNPQNCLGLATRTTERLFSQQDRRRVNANALLTSAKDTY